MALTPVQEAQVLDLLAQQSALLSLASSEATIISKLGATKKNISQVTAASALADADLMFVRQGTTDKSTTTALIKSYLGLGVTPPQFDNDLSVATTEFVKRAAGSYAGQASFNSAQTLTAAHAGYLVYLYGATTYTITMPAANSVPAGTCIEFYSDTSIVFTISRGGADTFYAASGYSALTTVKIGNGESYKFESNGVNSWTIVGGSAQLKYTGAFASSLGESGWKRYPDVNSPTGYVITQWGYSSFSPSTGGGTTVSFPIPFPNTCYFVIPVARWQGTLNYAQIDQITVNNFVGVTSHNINTNNYWQAFGY